MVLNCCRMMTSSPSITTANVRSGKLFLDTPNDKPCLEMHSRGESRVFVQQRNSRVRLLILLQVTKYKTRNGISSRDLLRLSHPKPSELGKRKREEDVPDMQLALKFAAHPDDEVCPSLLFFHF